MRVRSAMRGRRPIVLVVASLAVVGLVAAWRAWMLRIGTTVCPREVSDVITIDSVCENYAEKHDGAHPPSLAELVLPDAQGRTWFHGEPLPLDPWGRAYRYEPPGAEFRFARVWTNGKDGLPGGSGDDADVGGWMFR